MTLSSVLGTDVHFSGDESGIQWEDYFLRAAECNGVENDDVGRSRRAITDARYECAAQYGEGAHVILQGSEQEQRDSTTGVKAPYRMLSSTTSPPPLPLYPPPLPSPSSLPDDSAGGWPASWLYATVAPLHESLTVPMEPANKKARDSAPSSSNTYSDFVRGAVWSSHSTVQNSQTLVLDLSS